MAALRILKRGTFTLNVFFAWSAAVLFYMLLSSFWAIRPGDTVQAVKNLLIVSLITAVTSLMVEEAADLKKLSYGMIWAFFAETVYVLSRLDLSQLGEKRIGAEYAELSQWNANAIGAFTAVGCVLCVLGMLQKRKKQQNFLLELCLAVFFLATTLLTGSRKALFIIGGTFVIFVVLYNGNRKRMRNLCLAGFVLLALFAVIMLNDDLYTLIGARIGRMIQELMGHATTENSMSLRKGMISSGWGWFLERPVQGYGLAGFAELYGQSTGWKVYSHCNFIEILVGGGMIGFLLYYAVYAYALWNLGTAALRHTDFGRSFVFALLLMMLFNNVALVCYADIVYISVLMLACCYLKFPGWDGVYSDS